MSKRSARIHLLLLVATTFAVSLVQSQLLRNLVRNDTLPQLTINYPLYPLTPASTTTVPPYYDPNIYNPILSRAPAAAAPPAPIFITTPLPSIATRLDSSSSALLESYNRISRGAQQFGLELFSKISDAAYGTGRDIMISPFAIWSLLLLLAEGAAGNTLVQLRNTLHIDEDPQALRRAFREVQNFLKVNTSTVEVASLQALFTDKNQPVNRDYENIIERDYGSQLIPVDFHNVKATYEYINAEVRTLTRGLIQYTVLPQDLQDATLFLLSSLFFKGQWKHPFNKSLTRSEPFYDESGNVINNVEMMVQEANFNYVGINELEAHVLELPYGKEDRLSMLIVLPKRGVSLNKVVHNLQNIGIPSIFAKLASSAVGFEDENVEVFLPKFSTLTDLTLRPILEEMGIVDIFSGQNADLSRMSENVFVSKFIHTTKIIVNEEGTTAAAVTTAVLANKATPPKFYLNRPFFYLIMEKSTNLLLFAGQVTNPKV